ncbi:MAG TPA: 3-isopropylmalate dehydratase small subunit [Vicinamibacterales bacterium]|nr:3-isopropylmalate dehydratase small subunit [Vicinamibacterales bacterium]
MQPFRTHRGQVAPLLRRDIDTDQLIPKQFLKSIARTGFGQHLFHDWRLNSRGQVDTSFVLNQPRFQSATILLTGANFGCGSSREHAAWALTDFGFRAIIAPSFADIFAANAVTNGLLPVVLAEADVATLASRGERDSGYTIAIDLELCAVTDSAGFAATFAIDNAARHRLLNGLDDIDLLLQYSADISAFEKGRPAV